MLTVLAQLAPAAPVIVQAAPAGTWTPTEVLTAIMVGGYILQQLIVLTVDPFTR